MPVFFPCFSAQSPVILHCSHVLVSSACGCADAHVGKGVSIGTVFASERYIAPMAVGVDIGIALFTHAEIMCLLLCCPYTEETAQSKIEDLCMCQ